MTDYKKLVEALRCKGLSKECDSCGYGFRYCPDSECNDACDVERIIDDAAAAIEALQATIELMKLNMPNFFSDAEAVKLPKMEVQDGQ